MTCWHCQDCRNCTCIACDGECQACKGIAKWNKLRVLLKDIDIRERRHWKLIKPEAPAHPFRRLIVVEDRDSATGVLECSV